MVWAKQGHVPWKSTSSKDPHMHVFLYVCVSQYMHTYNTMHLKMFLCLFHNALPQRDTTVFKSFLVVMSSEMSVEET